MKATPETEPSVRGANEHSPGELARFRAEFAPVAKRYRQWRPVVLIVILVLTVGCMVAGELFRGWPYWPLLIMAGFAAMVVAVLVLDAWPACPACRQRVVSKPRGYCGCCGAQAVMPGGWLARARCGECGAHLGLHKHRPSIRYCTHCGVKLDDRGV